METVTIRYTPYGAALALFLCRDIEIGLDGPAGTGKTLAALQKIHLALTKYPGARALVSRKTNTALAGSALDTYRKHVLHPSERVRYFGGNKERPAAYLYPNGSELVVTGLDKPDKVKSSAYDLALINEATECNLDDIELVRSRLRNGKMPYQQLVMDMNPDQPTHWLNQRMNSGITTRLVSRHEDNPRYWDMTAQDWTEEGRSYVLGTLGGLTGVRYLRLRLGQWAAAEGTVYEDAWDRAKNVIAPFTIPRDWPRYLSIDFGYVNPFVCKWYAVDGDGRLYCYRELYQTKLLVEDAAVIIALRSGWYHLLPTNHTKYAPSPAKDADPLPRKIICDHDAEDRATLEKHLRMVTTPAHKSVSDGIQKVHARLRYEGDSKPRLMYFSNCLITRDEELAAKKRPTQTIEEFDGYIWDQRQGMRKGEAPVKENDHGMDTDRYIVAALDLIPDSVTYGPRIY